MTTRRVSALAVGLSAREAVQARADHERVVVKEHFGMVTDTELELASGVCTIESSWPRVLGSVILRCFCGCRSSFLPI